MRSAASGSLIDQVAAVPFGQHGDLSPLARRLWQVLEPYHALTYFAPEAHRAFEHAGLRGFWRGYFAGRAAPLGPVGPGPVTACFFGFHPAFVARALPSVWAMATPEAALEARLAGVRAAVRRILPEPDWEERLAHAAGLAREAVVGCGVAGRPLFAANADLGWPVEPELALWHAATLVREHRGDGHVAVLVSARLDPCEAHVTKVAAEGVDPETIKPYRGWGADAWRAAGERLRRRELLGSDGSLTAAGRALRQGVERETDRLASEPIEHLGQQRVERLIDLLAPLAGRLADTGAIPYPNPIGVPSPKAAPDPQ